MTSEENIPESNNTSAEASEEVEAVNTLETENSSGQVISVDDDFAGDLDLAIAAAENGDVVMLGSSTYITEGIALDRDITIIGQEGTVIDGDGTAGDIFNISPGATGATIQNVEITNGNNAIYGDGAANLTLRNLDINNIGLTQVIRDGQNNSGITLSKADGLLLLDSDLNNIGRRGVAINNTEGAIVSGLTLNNINLDAEHAQSFDAGGIKTFNTNDVVIRNNTFTNINGFNIWNDTTNSTAIIGNVIKDAGDVFLAPEFNQNVDISGIYNEKSYNSIVRGNTATAVEGFRAFNATVFTTETMLLGENDFSSSEVNTTDFWANEEAEKNVAITEDPDEANFDLFAEEFFAEANIGAE